MKKILSLIAFMIYALFMSGQTQLDVQGNPASSDTVAKIMVNYSGISNVVGLYVLSEPMFDEGIGGYFHGGRNGVIGHSPISSGVLGTSNSANGVSGQSDSGTGVVGFSVSGIAGFFNTVSIGKADLILGSLAMGDDTGILSTNPELPESDLILRSYDNLIVELDKDNNDASFFEIIDHNDNIIFKVEESGNAELYANSTPGAPHLFLVEQDASDFTRLRMRNLSNTNYWDIAGGGVNNGKLNFYTSNVRGDIMSLNTTGHPLVMYNGAHLTDGGAWTNSSSVHLKTDFKTLDNQELLEEVAKLSIQKWRYKVEKENVKHIGPMAQDFYKAFGLGESETTIGTVDADGVALAAIQALYKKVKLLEEENKLIQLELEELRIHNSQQHNNN